MNHLCATLLLFCSSFNMSFDDDRNDFVEMIGRCAVEYNAYYTENQKEYQYTWLLQLPHTKVAGERVGSH